MAFLNSLSISASGLTAQKRRMDVITENIVNRETTRTESGDPYRRKMVVFREIPANNFANQLRNARINKGGAKGGVMISEIIEDDAEFVPVYDPNHPDADEDGYVMMPNVNSSVEMIDAMAASRSYSANIAAFEAMKQVAQKTLEIGK